ncbi:hypothetical protein QUF64_07925 [Anaerolineales bacterium HSG6]|nr:hypothetical protein [Anaerolineales bacterium HSG6]
MFSTDKIEIFLRKIGVSDRWDTSANLFQQVIVPNVRFRPYPAI